ncbi:unnamed protein product [Didymodactylos carnosus]|uniref:CN hydrolase domain-containing protein n=1 Tax=Didymodactylos carnosus TaxID=1234261 RepID=A0A815YU18_9BILA|nr:unnamed protein product [Didymodactylos carnosus]CAF1574921.1 unnamed protein product [Didymodactylos carnosus]CAF4274124.1 unnamed protein product [Didymodactylos carnosus]CAF4439743.1 unnamed protein product [Didymodactylos carnosus]
MFLLLLFYAICNVNLAKAENNVLRIAAYQGSFDLNCNTSQILDIHEKRIIEASLNKSGLIIFPEMSTIGVGQCMMSPNCYQICQLSTGSYFKYFQNLAIKYSIAIAYGYIEQAFDGKNNNLYNSIQLINYLGQSILNYRKVHLSGGDDCFTSGENFFVASLTTVSQVTVKIGIMTCFDGMMPESARILSLLGAQLVIHPSAYGADIRNIMGSTISRATAIQNGIYLAFVNWSINMGGPPYNIINGGSAIYDPHGNILAQAPASSNSTELLFARLDLELIDHCTDPLSRRVPRYYTELLQPVSC